MALLAMSECNAYLAYNWGKQSVGQPELTRVEWKQMLSEELFKFCTLARAKRDLATPPPSLQDIIGCLQAVSSRTSKGKAKQRACT